MVSKSVKAIEYVPEVQMSAVFDAVQNLLAEKGFSSEIRSGFERKLDKAWDIAELSCSGASLKWRSDRPRNFTVHPRSSTFFKGRGRTFRVCKDDTVNVGGIVKAMLSIKKKNNETPEA